MMPVKLIVSLIGVLIMAHAIAAERQLTCSPHNHDLDQNDNFSRDGRFLVYDTRETLGPGIEHCISIEMVEIATGRETPLYVARPYVLGARPAPGVGAASFSPLADEVIFIHGPQVSELSDRGPYAKPNRCGAIVPADGSGRLRWADRRDIATDRDTLPGAHRGGTHRHEFSLDGRRIGFTYDDFLLPQYDRTVGYMERHPRAPEGASHYFAILVPVAPKGAARPGELERAWGDSWVGNDGRMRAFIGKVRAANGTDYEQALFVADIPAAVDITTADAGSAARFPSPPQGIRIRRLTDAQSKPGYVPEGVVRGTQDGRWISFVWVPEGSPSPPTEAGIAAVIPAEGGYDIRGAAQPLPRNFRELPARLKAPARWHPAGDRLFGIREDNAVVELAIGREGDSGRVRELVPADRKAARSRLCVSPDGRLLAYNRPVADAGGAKNYAGLDFLQIFVYTVE
jgi:hypothetical protein